MVDSERLRELVEYCHACDGLIVVPPEALSASGLNRKFADALSERGRLSAAWIDLFDEAYRTYWIRTVELHRRAPRYWFPPRAQHVCIVTAADRVRPYFQPFRGSSVLLYESDFAPTTSSVEFGAFMILHAERMGLLRQIDPTLVANLSYLLTLNDEQSDALHAGCMASNRPDAPAFHAMADALSWLRLLHHHVLRPPLLAVAGARDVPGTGLLVPPSSWQALEELQGHWETAAREAWRRHRAVHDVPSAEAGVRILAWLAEERPPLLVTGAAWSILWDPEVPQETDDLGKALAGITVEGETSILADLATIARCSRLFLDSMRAPDELVDPAPYITEGGLSYIHKERKLIAYHIGPGDNEDRLWQSTPPYERFMLAGRTVHEWGHLAAESSWISVPPDRKAAMKGFEEDLISLMEGIYHTAPEAVKAHVAAEVAEMRSKHGGVGRAILKRLRVRIEDFQANLLASQFLSAAQMDTYVRNNVGGSVQDESATILHDLARQAYEVQYLRLAQIADPLDWFMRTTWFRERFVDTGVVTEVLFARLVEAIGAICDCYAVDAAKVKMSKSEGVERLAAGRP